jgi:hypothetical protein
VDYSGNFANSLAFGIHYISHFRRMDSYTADYCSGGDRHTALARQAGFVEKICKLKNTRKECFLVCSEGRMAFDFFQSIP